MWRLPLGFFQPIRTQIDSIRVLDSSKTRSVCILAAVLGVCAECVPETSIAVMFAFLNLKSLPHQSLYHTFYAPECWSPLSIPSTLLAPLFQSHLDTEKVQKKHTIWANTSNVGFAFQAGGLPICTGLHSNRRPLHWTPRYWSIFGKVHRN